MAIKEKYMNIDEKLIGDLSNLDDSNAILLVSDDRAHPYSSIEKIVNGNDKFIHLKETDTFCFAEPKYDENEKIIVKIENELAYKGIDTISIPKDKGISLHASSEDLMLMINLLKPKYFMPVKGEYRYMVGAANLASDLGYKKENILLKQNGDIVVINNKKLEDNFEHIFIAVSYTHLQHFQP